MPLIYCRTPQRREEIVKEYVVTPIAHLKLINNRTVESCAGGTITDRYYVFHCTSRRNAEDFGEIYCGHVAARHLCNLINEDPPRLFNPLLNDENDDETSNNPVSEGSTSSNSGRENIKSPRQWNPAMKELNNAVNILLLYWPQMNNSVLEKIAEKIRPYPHKSPFPALVKSVNTMLRNHATTMRAILTEIESENGAVRNYSFTHLVEILNQEGVSQYFEQEAIGEIEGVEF